MDKVYISGPISYYILNYKNVKIYLFGDIHTTPYINSCNQYYSDVPCDSIDYDYSGFLIKHKNCWSIGALLGEWFQYNNDYNISTDFFIESSFSKSPTRYNIMNNEINRRRQNNLNNLNYSDERDPFSLMWLLNLEQFFRDCLL